MAYRGTGCCRAIAPRNWRSSGELARAILLSRSVPQNFRERREWTARQGRPPLSFDFDPATHPAVPEDGSEPGATSPVANCAFLRSDVDTNQWTPNWLGYSCYDAVLLTAEEFEGMAPPLQTALRRYAECGGEVLIHGRRVPPLLSEGGEPDRVTGYRVGLGHVAASGRNNWNAAARLIEKTVATNPSTAPGKSPATPDC